MYLNIVVIVMGFVASVTLSFLINGFFVLFCFVLFCFVLYVAIVKRVVLIVVNALHKSPLLLLL